MALEIENERIIGTIDDLEEKLEGKLPIDRLELLYLVNSWGRTKSFYIFDINQDIDIDIDQDIDIDIEECEAKECYDLSKLDVSEITNMGNIFCFSNFNGNIENWDVSNVINMNGMFYDTEQFNQDISNWDVSNVTDMSYIFYNAKAFNQNISSWNLDNIKNSYSMFNKAESFLDKYNSGEPLSSYIDKIKEWFNLNRDKMNDLDLKDKHGEEVDNFFSNITDIYSTNRIGLHENLLTECNKLCL